MATTNPSAVELPVRPRALALDAAAIYLVLRLVSAVLIVVAQRFQPAVAGLSSAPYLGMLTHWDGVWFRTIALSGYPRELPHTLAGRITMNEWAFFPGFPFLTRALMQVAATGFATAASVVNLVCGLVAAIAMAGLLASRISRAAALAVVAVWAALPMAPVLQLAYSEALAMALLCLSLLWLHREQWGRAAVAAVLLGLTRPILPPLALVYAVAVWLRWRRRSTDPLLPGERRRAVAGLVATLAGGAAWPLIAWAVTGVPGAYARTEAAWHHGHLTPFAGLVGLDRLEPGHPTFWLRSAVALAICVAVVLAVVAVRSRRLGPLLGTWCVAYLVFNLATGNMHANEFRMLLPLFPLVAVGCGLASTLPSRHWRRRVWLGIALGIAGQYVWVILFVRYLPGVPRAA